MGEKKKMEEEKGRKKWGISHYCVWELGKEKMENKKNGGQLVWEFGVRRISKEKIWEREKMGGRPIVGGRVRGERKKEKEKKNRGLGEVVQLPSPQERPNGKR